MKIFRMIPATMLMATHGIFADPRPALDTTIHQPADRRVIIEHAPGIQLPDPPERAVRPVPEPQSVERLEEMAAEWRAQRASHPFIHAGATVYRTPLYGHAPPWAENTCVELVWWRNSDVYSMEELAFTTAHEIGHILLGEGHPDAPAGHPGGHGPAWLQGTTLVGHRKRLMCSGNHYILGHSRMLVKAEWDKAEQWLIDNPDVRENENNE